MGKNHRHRLPGLLRPLLLALLGLGLAAMQGCAFIPFATAAASFALPQTASLAVSGAKAGYRTALVAADERDVNTIMRDNMLTLKAKSSLLADSGAGDVHVYAYTSDVFAVGVVDTDADRDRIIQTLQGLKGVDEVKGVIRLRSQSEFTLAADSALQNYTRIAVGRYLLHKNVGVEIEAVQGELCLMGVVGSHAEALDLIQYVESVSGARTASMLAIRDEYASGRPDTNRRYVLTPSFAPRPPSLAPSYTLPSTPIAVAGAPAGRNNTAVDHAVLAKTPHGHMGTASLDTAQTWNKARHKLSTRLQTLAKGEKNPDSRGELLTLAAHINADHDLSISDRLSVAAAQAKTPSARATIQALLAQY